MAVLTSNENVQRLERLGMQALRCRSFARAEGLFREQLAMLRDFRYADELSMAITLNNLALALQLQGKNQRADNLQWLQELAKNQEPRDGRDNRLDGRDDTGNTGRRRTQPRIE